MNLTIDSTALNLEKGEAITMYFKDKFPSHLKQIGLRSITMRSSHNLLMQFRNGEPEGVEKVLYINCNMVDKNANLFNANRSESLGLVILRPSMKNLYQRYDNCWYKQMKSQDFSCIQLYLTGSDQKPLTAKHPMTIVYELEFL
jgi:hypothetical protein